MMVAAVAKYVKMLFLFVSARVGITKMSGKMGGFVDNFGLACWPEC